MLFVVTIGHIPKMVTKISAYINILNLTGHIKIYTVTVKNKNPTDIRIQISFLILLSEYFIYLNTIAIASLFCAHEVFEIACTRDSLFARTLF